MTRDHAAEALLRERMDALCDAVDEERSRIWNVLVGDRECADRMAIELPADAQWFAFIAQKDGRRLREITHYFTVGTASTASGAVDALTSTLSDRANSAIQQTERAVEMLHADVVAFTSAWGALSGARRER